MGHYYPLSLTTKVNHRYFGHIPNQKFKKWKKKLLKYNLISENSCKNKEHISFEDLLAMIYHNLTKHQDKVTCGCRPDVMMLLCKIIPIQFFGSRLNRKRFLFIVRRILTQTYGEYMHASLLYEGFDDTKLLWLNTAQNVDAQVLQANILILQTVVKPLIQYYYNFLNTFRTRPYQLIPKGVMDSFIDRNIANTIKLGRMVKIENSSQRPYLTGKLIFIPKSSISQLQHRPLIRCTLKDTSMINIIQTKLKTIIKSYQVGSHMALYEKWVEFVKINEVRNKLYAIKLDLFDAFGMVDVGELKSIIMNDEKVFKTYEKEILFDILSKQYLEIRGNKIYKWTHGLLQGTRLSPILCELYLSYITYKHLKMFNRPKYFLHRTVDDILFVSTCESVVIEFELAAYRISIVNERKTHRFLNRPGENPCIVFCGKMFNLETREIGTAYQFQKGADLRGRFKLWNTKIQFSKDQAYEFIISCIKFSCVNFFFSKFELNTICNTTNTVLRNIYDGMCFVGFRFFYVIDSIDYLFATAANRCTTILRAIEFVLHNYTCKIRKIITGSQGKHFSNILSSKIIKLLCLRAFIVVLQRRHFKYKEVIAEIKRMAKGMRIKNIQQYVELKHIAKLPQPFQNISMRRTIKYDNE